MSRFPVRAHTRNGHPVRAHTRGGRGIGAASAVGIVGVVCLGVWLVTSSNSPMRTVFHDPLRDLAQLHTSHWFSVEGVVCEAGTYQRAFSSHDRSVVRCQLSGGRRLQPASGRDPLCESDWHGTTVAVESGGRPQWVCIDGPLQPPPSTRPLSPGQSMTVQSHASTDCVVCHAIAANTMQCRDGQTGHGFDVSPTGYRFYVDMFGPAGT